MVRILLILLLVVSCGKKSSSGDSTIEAVTCTTDATLVNDNDWIDTFNNDVYRLSDCSVGMECSFCHLTCGSSPNDFKMQYSDDQVLLYKYFYDTTIGGPWKICGDTLTIEWTNGDTSIFKKDI